MPPILSSVIDVAKNFPKDPATRLEDSNFIAKLLSRKKHKQ